MSTRSGQVVFSEEMVLLAFKAVQILVLATFGLLISGHRVGPGMRPVMPSAWIIVMKLCYPVPLLTYGYVLWTMDSLSVFDAAALALTAVGTMLVARARIDLGDSHTWAGYSLPGTRLVTSGIYAWMRHPLYVGIVVAIAGSLLTIVPHGAPVLTGVEIFFVSAVLLFLVVAGYREHLTLARELGEEYGCYCNCVHSCLPLRRFEGE